MTNNNKESILKTKLFKKIFGIPSIIWLFLSIVVMITYEGNDKTLNLPKFIIGSITILLMWFGISYVIALITYKVKSKNNNLNDISKNQNITKSNPKIIDKKEIEISKKKNKKVYKCESIIDCYNIKEWLDIFQKYTGHMLD